MAKYTLVESRDPFGGRTEHLRETARSLAEAGNEVSVFYIQNGVFAARPHPGSDPVADLTAANVDVLVDSFSLRERGIADDRVAAGARPVNVDVLVDHMSAGHKVIWH